MDLSRGIRFLRRASALCTALFLLGCEGNGPLSRNTLFVYVVPPDNSRSFTRAEVQAAWAPLLRSFRLLHPDLQLEFLVFPPDRLLRDLPLRNRRGLGPDLLIVNVTLANELRRRGLIDKVQLPSSLRDAIEPQALAQVRVPGGLSAFPLAVEPQLSCFDRSRIDEPPATLDQLLGQAAGGRRIGLSVSLSDIWWSAGALGADRPIAALMSANGAAPVRLSEGDRRGIRNWLQWLHEASLQSRVSFLESSDELVDALISGQLDWIPCSSVRLPALRQKLGHRLGLATLPNGSAGMASPHSLLRVWAFGLNSSPAQRRLAMELAEQSLNPLTQRMMTIANQLLLPVNRLARPPVESSANLRTLVEATRQLSRESALLDSAYSYARIERLSPAIKKLITEVVTGVTPVGQGTDALIRVLSSPP